MGATPEMTPEEMRLRVADLIVADDQVNAAARVLYNLEHPRGDDLWSVASDDDRQPYLYVARKMLRAAAELD